MFSISICSRRAYAAHFFFRPALPPFHLGPAFCAPRQTASLRGDPHHAPAFPCNAAILAAGAGQEVLPPPLLFLRASSPALECGGSTPLFLGGPGRPLPALAGVSPALECGGLTPLFFCSAGVFARFVVRHFLCRFHSQRSGRGRGTPPCRALPGSLATREIQSGEGIAALQGGRGRPPRGRGRRPTSPKRRPAAALHRLPHATPRGCPSAGNFSHVPRLACPAVSGLPSHPRKAGTRPRSDKPTVAQEALSRATAGLPSRVRVSFAPRGGCNNASAGGPLV